MKRRSACCTLLSLLVVALALAPGAGAGAVQPAVPSAAGCPVAPDPSALPDAATLREMNSVVAALRVRPTGSGAQNTYIKWILRQLAKVPGAAVNQQHFTINRWAHGSMQLQLKLGEGTAAVPIAAPVPYAEGTPGGGASAPLVRIPDEEKIKAADFVIDNSGLLDATEQQVRRVFAALR